MYDSNSKGISYTAGFFMLIAFAVAGLIFAALLGNQVSISMTGKNLEELSSGKFDPADAAAYKIIQALSQVFGYLIPTLIAAFVLHRRPVQLLGYHRGFKWSLAGMTVLIMIMALIASGGLSYVNHQIPVPPDWKLRFDKLETEYSSQVEAIINLDTPVDYMLALFFMALLPAICEETLFRGGLQNFLTRSTQNPVLSILIVSVIFSAVHFSFYGFLSRFFLGVVLGFLYYYSGRMWPNILAHFVNNALALTALYLYKREGKSISEAMTETQGEEWWGLLALPVVIALLVYFKRMAASTRDENFSNT